MDMRWFDDVLVLLEERNMTRAADRRNITQPAFSRRIRSFEEWLGVTVLERHSNRVEISPALAANEGEIRALVARLTELRTKVAHFDPVGATVAIAAQHAPMVSTFPDMAVRARAAFPGVRFRMRAGNLNNCVSLFLRGDTQMLVAYEPEGAAALHFGADVRRGLWGRDYLVPVVGGALRYRARANGAVPANTPAIVYPESSAFGAVLARNARPFGTPSTCTTPALETAFSSGMRELVRGGLGVGWLPYSMVHREIESGEFISLATSLGREPLEVAIYADTKSEISTTLLDLWTG